MNIPHNIQITPSLLKGLDNEDFIFKYLKSEYPDIKKSSGYFSVFDFYTSDTQFEVKSRNNKHDKYPSTIIGYNKIQLLQREGLSGKFYFLFTDGLYLWNYVKGQYHIALGGIQSNKKYAYIKIQDLKLIDSEITSL